MAFRLASLVVGLLVTACAAPAPATGEPTRRDPTAGEEASSGAQNDRTLLEGDWHAVAMEADGEPAPAEAVAEMRFRFVGDHVIIWGNTSSGEPDEATFVLDLSTSPPRITITPPAPDEDEIVRGIFQLDGSRLRLCLRHGSAPELGYPTELATTPGAFLLLVDLEKR